MQALVLVGGFGTRLRPLTLTRPKQMLPVGGRSMLERVVDGLRRHGVTEVVLSMGYRPDAFERALPDGTCAGVPLRFVVEDEPLGTAGAIAFAASEAGVDDTFLVLNGDIISDFDLTALVGFHREASAEATIALKQVDDPSRFGVVVTDDVGRVERFVEKPPRDEAPSDLINAGAYVVEPALLDRVPDGRAVSIEREVFPAVVANGALRARADDAYWLDCGTPEALLRANADLLSGVRDDVLGVGAISGTVAGGATVESAWIGAGAIVHAGAKVIDSVLFDGAVVGAGATVERSLVGEGATVGAGAQVRALSVVGDGVEIEPGTVLDGERVPAPES
ncbi:MAG: NDP-sugar synthase [Actinomycetota bacterium]